MRVGRLHITWQVARFGPQRLAFVAISPNVEMVQFDKIMTRWKSVRRRRWCQIRRSSIPIVNDCYVMRFKCVFVTVILIIFNQDKNY